MCADVHFSVNPEAVESSDSTLHRIIDELKSGDWEEFRVAVHFAKHSGNSPDLLDALEDFLRRGKRVELTFGADVFNGDQRATEYAAIRTLLERLERYGTFVLHLYRERHRTFHPKIYAFWNLAAAKALLIIGSSNWSDGGFRNNVEANVVVSLDLSLQSDNTCFDAMRHFFDSAWRETT